MATHLVEVDDWLPESVLHLVEVSHTDFTEVTRMVLVHVCAVVVLTTSKTTTTGMLSVLAYTTVTGRDVTAAVKKNRSVYHSEEKGCKCHCPAPRPISNVVGIAGMAHRRRWEC